MKKVLSVILALAIVLSVTGACAIDLSGMSFDELVALKQEINIAITKTDKWQEVVVPQGVWKVGEDIPAGHWTVRCADGTDVVYIEWGVYLKENGHGIQTKGRNHYSYVRNPESKYYNHSDPTEYDFVVQDGDWIVINDSYGKALFSPYTGKPDLGFH